MRGVGRPARVQILRAEIAQIVARAAADRHAAVARSGDRQRHGFCAQTDPARFAVREDLQILARAGAGGGLDVILVLRLGHLFKGPEVNRGGGAPVVGIVPACRGVNGRRVGGGYGGRAGDDVGVVLTPVHDHRQALQTGRGGVARVFRALQRLAVVNQIVGVAVRAGTGIDLVARRHDLGDRHRHAVEVFGHAVVDHGVDREARRLEAEFIGVAGIVGRNAGEDQFGLLFAEVDDPDRAVLAESHRIVVFDGHAHGSVGLDRSAVGVVDRDVEQAHCAQIADHGLRRVIVFLIRFAVGEDLLRRQVGALRQVSRGGVGKGNGIGIAHVVDHLGGDDFHDGVGGKAVGAEGDLVFRGLRIGVFGDDAAVALVVHVDDLDLVGVGHEPVLDDDGDRDQRLDLFAVDIIESDVHGLDADD